MRTRVPLAFLAGLLLAGCNGVKDDHEALEGSWNVVSAEEGGKAPDKTWKKSGLIIQGDNFMLVDADSRLSLKQKIDPTKSPKQMDLEGQGFKWTGIYELNGDDLKLCFDETGKERPADFKTAAGDNRLLMVLKRKPTADAGSDNPGGGDSNAKYKIAVIPKGLTHEFWQSIHRGADRAAADLTAKGISVEILWDGPHKESDSLEQINLIKAKTSMGINGLVLAPQDSVQMVKPVEQVVKKHIPVVIIDSGLDKEALADNPDLIVKYVATNNYNGGQLAAQRLLEVMNEAGIKDQKIVLFRYAPGSESTEQREQGFHDAIDKAIAERKPGDPNIAWLSDNKYAGATVSDAKKTAGPLLDGIRDQNGVGIFAVNESAAAGMLNSMKTLNLRKKFKYVGFDSSEQLLPASATATSTA